MSSKRFGTTASNCLDGEKKVIHFKKSRIKINAVKNDLTFPSLCFFNCYLTVKRKGDLNELLLTVLKKLRK